VRLQGLGKLKKMHLVRTRTRDLSAFSTVPQHKPDVVPSIEVVKFAIPENLRSEEMCNECTHVCSYPVRSWIFTDLFQEIKLPLFILETFYNFPVFDFKYLMHRAIIIRK
jgi:hypothetical protein